VVGKSMAMEIVLTGNQISAQEAEKSGEFYLMWVERRSRICRNGKYFNNILS